MSAGFYFIGTDNCKYRTETLYFTVNVNWLRFYGKEVLPLADFSFHPNGEVAGLLL